jgi:hypothetical protein
MTVMEAGWSRRVGDVSTYNNLAVLGSPAQLTAWLQQLADARASFEVCVQRSITTRPKSRLKPEKLKADTQRSVDETGQPRSVARQTKAIFGLW